MTDIHPEADRTLTLNIKQAHRHLDLIEPYGGDRYDPIDVMYPSDPADARPIHHPVFDFIVKTDVEGRDDQPVKLSGMLDTFKDELHRYNTTGRNGIFVELPSESCIAVDVKVSVLPRMAPPVLPSIVVNEGGKAGGYQYERWLYLSSKPFTAKQRDAVTEVLQAYGTLAEGKTVLMRLAGFFNRVHGPQMVSAAGFLCDDGARHGVRFDPAELARTFAGRMAPAE